MTPLSAITMFVGFCMLIFPEMLVIVSPKMRLWIYTNMGKVVALLLCGAIVAITGAFL